MDSNCLHEVDRIASDERVPILSLHIKLLKI